MNNIRTHLMPMDIVAHDKRLWVVTTAHLKCQKWQNNETCNKEQYSNCGYQAVSLCLYDKDNTPENRKENVPMCECKIIKDFDERKYTGDNGLYFFPDTDFD